MTRSIRWAAWTILLVFASGIAKNQPAIQYPDLVRPKQPIAVSSNAAQYLEKHQESGKVKVWVFFTDKGVYTKGQLESATLAARETLTPRALARRAKHGVNVIEFADLPVNPSYVDLVANTGAKLRWASRWLNAASFEVDPATLDQIGKLPFVEKIQPVAVYKRSIDTPVDDKSVIQQQKSGLDSRGLSYGSSAAQLTQISVPQCHDSNYAGQGVIISMFDSGFRTTHNSFTQILSQGRLLAKYDFVFHDTIVDNQMNDDPSAWSHGTSTWSTCGGENPGVHYGPAYKASFILCKTEDIRSETQVEEDNWVAAVQFVDSIGTDIISSSLGYSDWYTTSDYDGRTCVTTLAALQAARYGILVCNSIGNSGPGATTMGAPADADSIISVGAVNSSGTIVSFSSRGPTADGRVKPEVCALGSSDYVASSSSNSAYSYSSGTSFSCPLTAGAAAVIWGAHPDWTNMQVRQAMMMTASRASTPDNSYGWGIVNTWAALHVSFAAPYVHGDANHDGTIDISDVVYLISYIFSGGPEPSPKAAGDSDCSGTIDISDAVYLISYIFSGGSAPC
jgi:serine protease AprX